MTGDSEIGQIVGLLGICHEISFAAQYAATRNGAYETGMETR